MFKIRTVTITPTAMDDPRRTEDMNVKLTLPDNVYSRTISSDSADDVIINNNGTSNSYAYQLVADQTILEKRKHSGECNVLLTCMELEGC